MLTFVTNFFIYCFISRPTKNNSSLFLVLLQISLRPLNWTQGSKRFGRMGLAYVDSQLVTCVRMAALGVEKNKTANPGAFQQGRNARRKSFDVAYYRHAWSLNARVSF